MLCWSFAYAHLDMAACDLSAGHVSQQFLMAGQSYHTL